MKVLIIEEDHFISKIIEKVVKNLGLDPVKTGDADMAVEMTARGNIHIAVIDKDLAGVDGGEICKKIRKLRLGRYVYMIMLGGATKKNGVMGALEAGADEFLLKPFDEGELSARIRVGVRIHQFENKLVNSQKKLMKLAKEDPVTRTFNRRVLLDEGLRELNRTSREKGSLSMILVEAFDFKSINEQYGKLAGDLVLIEFARRLEKCCREYDKLGRYGDKEFLLLLPRTDRKGALVVAERILKELNEWPLQFGDSNIELSANIGIGWYAFSKGTRDQDTIETILNDLLVNTERALVKAKEQGKNNLDVYEK